MGSGTPAHATTDDDVSYLFLPNLLAMTGLQVTNDTQLEELLLAEVQHISAINTDRLLADSTKKQLVQDARAAIELPAEGPLTFQQKRQRQLSYISLAVVNADRLRTDETKTQLV